MGRDRISTIKDVESVQRFARKYQEMSHGRNRARASQRLQVGLTSKIGIIQRIAISVAPGLVKIGSIVPWTNSVLLVGGYNGRRLSRRAVEMGEPRIWITLLRWVIPTSQIAMQAYVDLVIGAVKLELIGKGRNEPGSEFRQVNYEPEASNHIQLLLFQRSNVTPHLKVRGS